MKKNFFYFALAAVTALSLGACSSDDDEAADHAAPVTLTTPANAEHAVQYKLVEAMASDSQDEGAPSLASLDVTESSKLLLELRDPRTGKLSYVMEDVNVSNNIYTMSGSKVKGTVAVKGNAARTRATDELVINISVTFSDGVVTFSSGDEAVSATSTTVSGDEVLNNLARTWKISGVILDLKSKSKDIKAFEEFDSKSGVFDLLDVLAEAEEQGINLTEKEKAEFNRQIKTVTITKTGQLAIDYADGREDVASWQWADSSKSAITIKLKDVDMGNKFFSDNTKISLAFSDRRCNLKLETKVQDNSGNDWEVELILKLYE